METNSTEQPQLRGSKKLKQLWLEMTVFERFEHIVLLFISFLLAVIIIVALVRLTENTFHLALAQIRGKTEFAAFQTTFGMLLTLLIAFEFRNSINSMMEGKGLLAQVEIIVLIAIIALARKFLVLDPQEYDATIMAAYASVALALGVIYWLLGRKGGKINN